ncbi:MAG: sigma-54-dependent Fis family transcriptional regulator, partial [Calditrichia bacterium]|nr:sigma-54-dependent Fis family transcriptional regulator [Calditrichia bacterium]
MKFNILILDDEQLVCKSLKRIIDAKDRQIFTANNYKEAEKILKEESIDLMLLDYKLGEMDGISVLKELNGKYESLLVIMITAYGSIDVAVEAMKLGAYDFIQKKVDPDFIRYTVQRALDNLRLKKEVDELKTTFQDNICMPRMVATSLKMKSVLKLAGEYSKSDSTVLIQGETGTGKGIMAE